MMDSSETQHLLQQTAAGDRDRFPRLFARHRAYLRQVVELRLDPRVRARVDPSDVVQETQMEAFRRLAGYPPPQPRPVPPPPPIPPPPRRIPSPRGPQKPPCAPLLPAPPPHAGPARRSVGREV